MQRRSRTHSVVHTRSFETYWNLMIWSAEWELQISMHSAWNRNDRRQNKKKILPEFDEGFSGPQITSDSYRSVQRLYMLFTNFCPSECDATQMIYEIAYRSCEYNEILVSSTQFRFPSRSTVFRTKLLFIFHKRYLPSCHFINPYCLQLLVPSIVNYHSSGVVN
jgi:hypothetical protein